MSFIGRCYVYHSLKNVIGKEKQKLMIANIGFEPTTFVLLSQLQIVALPSSRTMHFRNTFVLL